MLDVVFIAMFLVPPALLVSKVLASKGKKEIHRWIQTVLALVLLIAVVAFEVEVRFFTDWRTLAQPSPWFEGGWCHRSLYLHLLFAIPTPFLWMYVIYKAIRNYQNGFSDPKIAAQHRRLGNLAMIMMTGTAFTGILFYWISFVA